MTQPRKLRFTKMHGVGNDFVMLDATRAPIDLTTAQFQYLADRHFGIGADQILIVGPAEQADIDFSYRIVNADGQEVEQCGNGARCFARFVLDNGLSDKTTLRVSTVNGLIELRVQPDGLVTVNMGTPVFDLVKVPFSHQYLTPSAINGFDLWPLTVQDHQVHVAVLSMGNPHAVLNIAQLPYEHIDAVPVHELGPLIEGHTLFPKRVNAGFMQIINRRHIRLRIYERGSGETLACGSGTCAAVVAGIQAGWLDHTVLAEARGGNLQIDWAGPSHPVLMTGPATKVFEGEIEVPPISSSSMLSQVISS